MNSQDRTNFQFAQADASVQLAKLLASSNEALSCGPKCQIEKNKTELKQKLLDAQTKIKDILLEENNPGIRLRMYVQGGGCSGMSYGFTLDEIQNEDDFEIPMESSSVLVDAMSMQYVSGATIDYKDDLSGSQFVIKNPKAETTCGCGSSFSPG